MPSWRRSAPRWRGAFWDQTRSSSTSARSSRFFLPHPLAPYLAHPRPLSLALSLALRLHTHASSSYIGLHSPVHARMLRSCAHEPHHAIISRDHLSTRPRAGRYADGCPWLEALTVKHSIEGNNFISDLKLLKLLRPVKKKLRIMESERDKRLSAARRSRWSS
jgi:hypothetical protein